MSAPTHEIAQRIKSELTQQLWEKILLHADDGIRRHRWHGILGGPPLRGKTAEDFVQNAVLLTLKGRRNWKPENCSLEQHLKGAIDSEINHDSERIENRNVVRERTLTSEDSVEAASAFDRFQSETPTNEKLEIEKEWEDLILEFLEELADDKPVQQLFEALYDGTIKRADLARQLQVPETQIDVFRKRLGTRVKRFQAKKTKTSQEVPHA